MPEIAVRVNRFVGIVGSDNGLLERVKGIEPSSSAWEAAALPLSYTRDGIGIAKAIAGGKGDRRSP
jgi:hypothetical protein